ncbi:MAG TPA: hypothetical protein VGG62_17800 [Terracidiphilus sp.]|jgi:hypothetical protein
MTIDERLEKLVERHEALALSVEHLAMENAKMAAENAKRDHRMGEIMEFINQLAHIAESHDHRIENLEGGTR